MSPAKCGLKFEISVPIFSFTTATRGTPSSSSWGLREDSSEASYRERADREKSGKNVSVRYTQPRLLFSLCNHLSAQKSSRSSYGHDHSTILLPQTLRFDDLVFCRQNKKSLDGLQASVEDKRCSLQTK